MKKNSSPSLSRRRFLATSSAAALAPMIVPASVLGAGGRPAPSERITMGVVGWGMQGPGNTRAAMGQKDCQVVAACDVDKKHLQAAVDTVNRHYGNKDCKAYTDYRELMARRDIDTVMLAVPDNWHALIAVEAARQGKDIYGEKPLARTIVEQQAIVRAVQQNGRIWQTGSWQRSQENFHKAAEIVRNGLIGKVTRVEVGLPAGHHDFAGTKNKRAITPPPEWLDYDMWIGPARMQPYIECRVHRNWRWDYNIGGGQLLDWIGHHNDIAHWGMDWDHTGPLTVSGHGEFPPKDAIWNTATTYWIECEYPGGVQTIIAGGYRQIRSGTKWIGTDGWVWVDRGRFDCSIPELKDVSRLPEHLRKVKLYYSRNHMRNFLDCVKSRKPTITPVEVAHHSAVPGHLGLIAMLVGRKLRWDAEKEQILDVRRFPLWPLATPLVHNCLTGKRLAFYRGSVHGVAVTKDAAQRKQKPTWKSAICILRSCSLLLKLPPCCLPAKLLRLVLMVSASAGITSLHAQIPILQIGQPITEDFNTLESQDGQFSDILPPGWELVEEGSWADNRYQARTGKPTWWPGWDTYSYGQVGSSDRALGSMGSRYWYWGFRSTFGATLVNQTQTTVHELGFEFWGEQWRVGRAAGGLIFSYSLDADGVDDRDATWVAVDTLSVSRIQGGGPRALDGNQSENRAFFSAVLSGLHLGPGQSLVFRWQSLVPGWSTGDGLAIDDLTVVAGVPEPAEVGVIGASLLAAWAVIQEHRRRATRGRADQV